MKYTSPMLQFITIDTSALYGIGQAGPLSAAGQILRLGGWIPVTLVVLMGLAKVWLEWRQSIYIRRFEYMLLAIDVPKENEQLPKAVENIFSHVYGAYAGMDFIEKWWFGKVQPTFSFEIASHGGYVQFYIRTQKRYRDLVESAVFSQYPDAEINEVEDYTNEFKGVRFPNENINIFGVEFILKNKSYFSIRTYPEFEEKLAGEFKDPLGAMLESLSKIRPEEQVWIQILMNPAGSDWKKAGEAFIKKTAGIKEVPKASIIQYLMEAPAKLAGEIITHGGLITPSETKRKDETSQFKMLLLTPDTKAVLESVALKINKPAFNSKIRMMYLSPKASHERGRVIPLLKGSFSQYNALGMNSFGPYIPSMTKEDYFWEKWSINGKKNRMLYNYRERNLSPGASPYILNIEELATIYHFPIMTVKAPLIRKTESRRAEPPVGLPVVKKLPGRDDMDETPPPMRRLPPGIPFVE